MTSESNSDIWYEARDGDDDDNNDDGDDDDVNYSTASDDGVAESDDVDASANLTVRTTDQRSLLHRVFSWTTFTGARNVTIGGTQNIFYPNPPDGEQKKELSDTENISKRTLLRMKSWTERMVKTAALAEVMEKLKKGTHWITILGSPGEGKTTVAYMALYELRETGRQVFQVKSPKEFSDVTTSISQPVIMMDDIFGNLDYDQAKWQMWEDVLHDFLVLKEHKAHEQKQEDVTVIFVGRKYVINSASYNMGRTITYFTQDAHVVDMSYTVKRDFHEKMAIWKAISDPTGIQLDQNTVDKICQVSPPHGFPHVCQLFLTVREKHPDINAEEFFKTPLELLNQTVLNFMSNKLKLALFKEMIKGDGGVWVEELVKLENGSETIQTALDLVGTYLKKEDDYFLFDHPSIYDCVAYNIGRGYLQFVIENCNLSFIHERLRFQTQHDTPHDTNESDFIVYISRDSRSVVDLAKRFAAETFPKRNLLQVLSHVAFRDEQFIIEFMSQLTIPLPELIQLTDVKTSVYFGKQSDSKFSGRFLSLLASNKSAHLLKYINLHIDRQLTQEEVDTVLYGVCKYAASEVLTYLTKICDRIDVNVKYGDKEQTPLMMAATIKDTHLLQMFLSLNPHVDATDKYGTTALHYLCENGLVSVVQQMIDMGADVNVKTKWEWSPLYFACSSNQVDVVSLLLDRRARVDDRAVVIACKKGSKEIASLLFEKGATVNMISHGHSPLHNACKTGNMGVIMFLIDKGASVNIQDETGQSSPLHEACHHKKTGAVQHLLNHGAVVDVQDSMGDTPLHDASGTASEECVDMLLKAGANVNKQSESGQTPLHAAVYYTNASSVCLPSVHVCQTLIRQGADVNKQDTEGNTPLHRLCRIESITRILKDRTREPAHSYEDVYKALVTLLFDHGADVNILNNRGEPALHGWCQTLLQK